MAGTLREGYDGSPSLFQFFSFSYPEAKEGAG